MQSILLQSPMTAIEKLDLLYDLKNLCNRQIDGISVEDCVQIYQSILNHQQ